MTHKPRAVALISGGLDSMLAVRVIQDHGVEVEGINFFTGFCVEGHTHAIRERDRKRPKRNQALWVAEQLGVRLHMVEVVEEYKEVLTNPKHGYGANLNPCLDCKGFLVRKALEWMRAHDFDFLITGEVVGQRPKSHKRSDMPIIQRDSGAEDLLLRPLSAKLLPETYPERMGWVDRERLFDFSGRSRKPQMALARQLGFDEWAQPAGGCCFLTDAAYSAKLTDLWRSRGAQRYDLDDIMLLKVGRHLRPRPHFKVVISREEGETRFLEGYRKRFTHLRTVSHGGPLTLVDGEANEDDLWLAARLAARFSSGRTAERVRVEVNPLDGPAREIEVPPLPADSVAHDWYIGT